MFDNPFKENNKKYKRVLAELDLLNFKINCIMATIADITTSLDALDAAVAAIPAVSTGAITAVEADGVKARIDAATTALQGKVTA